MKCPKCRFENPADHQFCGKCGNKLGETLYKTKPIPSIEGERKHVTIMFCDLSGYTAMTERLDPEEVKGIMNLIFGRITEIIQSYEGFIEKFIGDAVMAVFGVPKAHEDDPVRAIRAAMEIHATVRDISPQFEDKIGRPLSMHTGINTGLVVTGEVDVEKGTHGFTGDAINVASRLEGIAKAGEIIVGPETHSQALNYFEFETLPPTSVKGKQKPISIYRVQSAKKEYHKTHRLQGLQAVLIGRDQEITILSEAVDRLKQNDGSVISISGDAGTGKSRLKKEFKNSLDLKKIQWFEGHAYGYTQNVPYYPLISLLAHIFQVDESDPHEKIRRKVESGVAHLLGESNKHTPYIGSLFALSYPKIEGVSPEYWKKELGDAIVKILSALADRKPTVICFEDLHWADPSFIELFKRLPNACQKTLFICTYRSHFRLFDSDQQKDINLYFQDIRLKDLAKTEERRMLESLLGTQSLPEELQEVVCQKVEGNPFYIEEMINYLIERKILTQKDSEWKLIRGITEADIPTTIQGVLAARIDRLNNYSKRVLREASVIGRTFLYRILERISEINSELRHYLEELESLDLIRTQAMQSDLEYMFKHVLTQEIAYNGLLKLHRREIHEKIAMVMESVFQDRLSEFYEVLAFHFSRGQSVNKAIDYLVKSGEKSLARYSVEEAHHYFRKAYDILSCKEKLSEPEKIILIDILNSWGYAYYYLGEIKEWIDLLKSHQTLAESLGDKARLGMFYAWFGCALITACKPKDAYDYLLCALELGERSSTQKVIGYACTWLSWACGWQGLFDEGINYGMRAQKISESFPSDQYLFFKSLSGICYIYYCQGKTKNLFEEAKRLLYHGEKTANNRSKVFGYWMNALGHLARGEMALVQKESEKSIEEAVDPFYSQFAKTTMGMSYLFDGRLQEAEYTFRLLSDHCEKHGVELMSQFAYLFLSFISFAKGNMKSGFRRINETQEILLKNHMKVLYATSEFMLGVLYTRFITGPSPGLANVAKNIGFIAKNAPFADRKAGKKFQIAIELFREMGAKGNHGQALLGLGRLHKAKKRKEKAHECFLEAIQLFQECDAHVYLKQAKEELASI